MTKSGIIAGCSVLAAIAAGAADSVRFNRDIRPIMSDSCFHCHGPDRNARRADMRLDLREVATNVLKDGKIPIVPGHPEKSEIIRRIFSDDPKVRMPYFESNKTLTDAQKNLFKQWVAEGADYEPHWAYMPLTRPQVPNLKSQISNSEIANPIDSFIRAKLSEKKIEPSREADRATLLRRLSLDLTGLPPTPAELAAFVNDTGPNAYEKLVDRLLASPRFGERMAVWWLDVARMADTVGFHGDQNQRIFPYRDYVINAFNSNKPFNQFATEQLAGDLLPDPTTEQLVASGFNRLNMMTREGGAQPKEYLAKYGAERVRTVGTAFLGSTFGCCECHDHKFDPISQRDFYSLQAFFADVKQWGVYSDYGYTKNPELAGFNNESPFPPEAQVESPYLKNRESKFRNELTAIAKSAATNQTAFGSWLDDVARFAQKNPSGWIAPTPAVSLAEAADKPSKKKMKKTGDKEPPEFSIGTDARIIFEEGPSDTTSVKINPGVMRVAAIRLEVLPDAKHKGSILRGGATNSEMVKLSALLTRKDSKKPAALSIRFADANAKEPRYKDGEETIGIQGGWKTSRKKWNEPQTSVWQLDQPQQLADGDEMEIKISDNDSGCIRVSVSPFATVNPVSGNEMSALVAAVANPDAANDPLVLQAWIAGGGGDAGAMQQFKSTLAKIYACRGGKTWSMISQPAEPLTIRILPRGNWMDESGDVVLPASPHFLPGIASTTNSRLTRLDFAKWLCSTSNPLTARAVMNRLWKQFFGNALSAVVDDLGAQGEPPSHPELLDWIACEFRDGGWDMKHMIKLFVTSATYKQSSSLRPELKDIDPNNRLLASQNPRRLDAEFVRDNALFIAGLLNTEFIGGPSVFPYQPADYYVNLQFPNRDYIASRDDEQWRRGLYMHWQRTFLHPMLANFDAPARDECAASRNSSSTPQQALTLLNDPAFVEAARVFASRVMNDAKSGDDARIECAYQLALARAPKPSEKESLKHFLATQREYFKAHADDAAKFLTTGIAPQPDGDKPEQAAWTAVCHVVLNLHESITRY